MLSVTVFLDRALLLMHSLPVSDLPLTQVMCFTQNAEWPQQGTV